MANFFIIDHSLCRAGGHHFDYVKCVAKAATDSGYQTHVAANRQFLRKRGPTGVTGASTTAHQFDDSATVECPFRDTTYQKDSYLAGLRHLKRSKFDLFSNHQNENPFFKIWNRFRCRSHRKARRKFITRFATDCEKYFRNVTFSPDDHVFLTTVSELELMGLSIYLTNTPKTEMANWHLQFHYNLFDGRTPEYDAQSYREKMVGGCVRSSLSRLTGHSINFYATSETLADQFNRLRAADFETLPYPISPKFAPNSFARRSANKPVAYNFVSGDSNNDCPMPFEGAELNTESDHQLFLNDAQDSTFDFPSGFNQPMRLVCPGEFRREKGCSQYMQNLVNRLWPDYLATGKLQIVIQRPKREWPQREKIELQIPDPSYKPDDLPHSPIEYLPHPLSETAYEDLIRSADCGLLHYDSRAYFSRRAGVLGELLACGKPVIVSAGSWLAQQIQKQTFQHIENLSQQYDQVSFHGLDSLHWKSTNAPMSGGLVSFDGAKHPFEFTVDHPEQNGIAIIKFDWQWPKEVGVDCEISVDQIDSQGTIIASAKQVVGRLPLSPKTMTAFRVCDTATKLQFSMRNAFHGSMASVKNLSVEFLDISKPWEVPLSAVGVIANGQDDLFNAVEEVAEHLEHYQATSQAFSEPWYAAHAATRTVTRLASKRQYRLNAA